MEVKIGQKFGKLTILKQVYNNYVTCRNNEYYLVKCDCGHEFLLRRDYLKTRTQCNLCRRKKLNLRQQLKNAFTENNIMEQNSLLLALCIKCMPEIEYYHKENNVDAMLKVIPQTLDK